MKQLLNVNPFILSNLFMKFIVFLDDEPVRSKPCRSQWFT